MIATNTIAFIGCTEYFVARFGTVNCANFDFVLTLDEQ